MQDHSTNLTPITADPNDSPLKFPSDIPVTAIGLRVDHLANEIAACVRSIMSDFDDGTIEMRPSKTAKYLAVAFTVHATSRAQLEDLNTALHAHPLVKIVL